MEPEVADHAAYRAVLAAMSRPGSVQLLPAAAPDPLLGLLRALLDHEASFWAVAEEGLEQEVRRATGARPAPLGEADFVLFGAEGSGGAVQTMRRGTFAYPEDGATAVYRVRALRAEGGQAVLRGPGIRDRCSPCLDGLPAAELRWLGEVNREFPLGVDAIFLDQSGRVLCLPRSSRIEVG